MEEFDDLMPPAPPALVRQNAFEGTPTEPEQEPETGMFGGRRHRRTRRHRGARRSIKRRAIARTRTTTRSKSKSRSMHGGKRRRRHTRK